MADGSMDDYFYPAQTASFLRPDGEQQYSDVPLVARFYAQPNEFRTILKWMALLCGVYVSAIGASCLVLCGPSENGVVDSLYCIVGGVLIALAELRLKSLIDAVPSLARVRSRGESPSRPASSPPRPSPPVPSSTRL